MMARIEGRLGAVVRHRWLLGIMLIGLLFRLWLWWRVPIHQPANDENEYLQVARDLIAGRGWVFYEHYHWLRAPLYPLFLAGSLWLAGGRLYWAALPNILVSVAAIPLCYWLGKMVVQDNASPSPEHERRAERAGIVAATLCALLLPFATFASLWMSETLFTALFAGSLVVLLRWARHPQNRLAALAGVLLGAATLTRSAPLAALPLLVFWMLWQRPRRVALRPYLTGMVVCVLMMFLTISPWTIRNWIAYGGFIPVETGLSYNLWAFDEPREDEQTIFRTLERIPNPVERSRYATAKGLERLREDPAILLRKLEPNWTALWRVKPIEDRFLQASYREDVPLGMFVTGLVLDDSLSLIIVLSASIALICAPGRAAKTLLGGWIVYSVLVIMLTHGEGRYRQFLFPALIPYAAACWTAGWWSMRARTRHILAALSVVVLLLPLQLYPYRWAVNNVRRGWFVTLGDRAMLRGDYVAAQGDYRRARMNDRRSPDVALKLGLAYDRGGRLDDASSMYSLAVAAASDYVPPAVLRGDALRREGRLDQAQQTFEGTHADPRAVADWAWQHLSPVPATFVDVGDGLDFGYVRGMYGPEEQGGRWVRWTSENAAVRLASGEGGADILLRLSAPRPDGRAVHVRLCAATQCQIVVVDRTWRSYRLFVPSMCTNKDEHPVCKLTTEVEIHAETFIPAVAGEHEDGQDTSDSRHLGVLIDYATSSPQSATNVPSPN